MDRRLFGPACPTFIRSALRFRKYLLPDSQIVAAQNQPDLLIGKSALRESLDEVVVVFVNGLCLGACERPWTCKMTFNLAGAGIRLVMAKPAHADVLRPNQF